MGTRFAACKYLKEYIYIHVNVTHKFFSFSFVEAD